jgi:hypothetical protein
MAAIETESFKYIFLDIVKFTRRSVEAQSDIVNELNNIVKTSVHKNCILEDNIIFIPTGDGICIAMKGVLSFDAHILVALDILCGLQKYNEDQKDKTRNFDVRIGINENIDNVIKDINGRVNVAGAGINFASRIMDNADGGQILVSQAVYDILSVREKYIKKFRSYQAEIKHNLKIPVHQYIQKDQVGLNINVPSNLSNKKIEYSLSKQSAYYFAHAIKNNELLVRRTGGDSYSRTPVALLWFLAEDSCEMSAIKEFNSPTLKQPGRGKLPIEEQFNEIDSTYYWILSGFVGSIIQNHLSKYHYSSFEECNDGVKCWFVINKYGQNKLKKEHPDIWQEFSLDNYV